jgi:hypothetical protein
VPRLGVLGAGRPDLGQDFDELPDPAPVLAPPDELPDPEPLDPEPLEAELFEPEPFEPEPFEPEAFEPEPFGPEPFEAEEPPDGLSDLAALSPLAGEPLSDELEEDSDFDESDAADSVPTAPARESVR